MHFNIFIINQFKIFSNPYFDLYWIFISFKITHKLFKSIVWGCSNYFSIIDFSLHSEHTTYNQFFNLFWTCCIMHHMISFVKCHTYTWEECVFLHLMGLYVYTSVNVFMFISIYLPIYISNIYIWGDIYMYISINRNTYIHNSIN